MDRVIGAALAAAVVAVAGAGPAAAQGACDRLQQLDNFGAIPFGARLTAMPEGARQVSGCERGLTFAECVIQDAGGVSYSLYDGYVFSKFVAEGDGDYPWGLEARDSRSLAARRMRAATGQTARGLLGADNQAHLRSTFACGDQFGSIFARYRGDRIVAVGIETPL